MCIRDRIKAVHSVLEELCVDVKDTILVLNKLDAVTDRITRNRLCDRYPHAVGISAQTGYGLEALAIRASDALGRSFRNVEVETDCGNGRLLAWLAKHGEVLSKRFGDERMTIHCRIPPAVLGRIDPDEAIVRDCEKQSRVQSRDSLFSPTRSPATEAM